jgi:hypothetical protein
MPANAAERHSAKQSAEVNVETAAIRLPHILTIAALLLPSLLFTFAS